MVEQFGVDSVTLFYGAISEQKRIEQVAKFRQSARFFVATPSCGGHGLTLNEAHYVLFYNNGFKYSERIQAEDRCHRIGQAHKVVYIDILAHCGIDERIDKALSKKSDVVAEFKQEVDKVKSTHKEKLQSLLEKL